MTCTLTDKYSRLFWVVEVLPAATQVDVGSYLQGEPWIALAQGQTALVRRVGRWTESGMPQTLAAIGAPTSLGGTEDLLYVGPKSSHERDGTVLNPLGGQVLSTSIFGAPLGLQNRQLGFDDRVKAIVETGNPPIVQLPGYNPAHNLRINDVGYSGLLVIGGDVLVSTVSHGSPCPNCGVGSWRDIWTVVNGNPCACPTPTTCEGAECSRCPTEYAGVLSVLSAPAPNMAFRKPYAMDPTAREGLTHLTLADIDWSKLLRLAWPSVQPQGQQGACASPNALSGCWPDPAMMAQFFRGAWIDHYSGEFAADQVNPTMHIPGYWRCKRVIHTAALIACLNPGMGTPGPSSSVPDNTYQFVDMVRGLLQIGIDVCGLRRDATHSFNGSGGLVGGRKFPVAFAGHLFANPYAGMDGWFAGALPPGLPQPPRWTTWVADASSPSGYVARPQFQEDAQFYGPLDPLADPILGDRSDWEWTGSPWLWCSSDSQRDYQATLPSSWTNEVTSADGAQSKMPTSTGAHAMLALAIRLLRMESAWELTGYNAYRRTQQVPPLPPLSNEPLHPMLGYIDRLMMPSNTALKSAYESAVAGSTWPGRDGLNIESEEANFRFPYRGYSPKFTSALHDRYRAEITSPDGVTMLPSDWLFRSFSTCPTALLSPNIVSQYSPREGKPILVEMYRSSEFVQQTVPGSSGPSWVALYALALPVPPYQLSLGLNSVTMFADPAANVLTLQPFGLFGATSDVVPIPALSGSASNVGQSLVVQALLIDLGTQGATGCIAASNALKLTVQP